MPTWLIIIIVVAVIGGILGYFCSDDGEDKGKNALTGAATSAVGCGYVILQIALTVLGLSFAIWLFKVIFC